jgi:hypothetical protein
MKTLLSALLLLVLATSVAYAEAEEVYRTVKPDGTVIYSDRPISADSVLVQVQSRPTSEARAAAEAGAANAFAAQPAAPGDDEALAAAREEQARLRAAACAEARRTLATYENSPRLYEQLPDGGRRFLTDEETVQARQAARQAVADYCEPDGGN